MLIDIDKCQPTEMQLGGDAIKELMAKLVVQAIN